MFTFIRPCIHAYPRARMHACKCARVHAYSCCTTHARIHTYIRIHITHTHTHTHTPQEDGLVSVGGIALVDKQSAQMLAPPSDEVCCSLERVRACNHDIHSMGTCSNVQIHRMGTCSNVQSTCVLSLRIACAQSRNSEHESLNLARAYAGGEEGISEDSRRARCCQHP